MEKEDSLVQKLNKLEIIVKFKVSDILLNGVSQVDVIPEEVKESEDLDNIGQIKISKRKYTKKTKVKGRYSDEDRRYILTSSQTNSYLANRFDTTPKKMSRLKSRWKSKLSDKEAEELKKIRNTRANYKVQEDASKEYKVESAGDV